jgi:hypothetical protein
MATVTTFQIPTLQVPRTVEFGTDFAIDIAIPSGAANNGDVINVFVPPKGARFTGLMLSQDATLGAGATLQARIGTVTLTGATTAGAASTVVQNASDVNTADGTLAINLLVGGANITAGTTVRLVGVMIMPRG